MTAATAGPEVAVRRADRADLLAVYRIEKASFPQPWPYAAFERFLGAPGFLVAEDGDEVVGYVVGIVVRDDGRPVGHVKDVAVHPDRRGEGIAKGLMERVLTSFATRGVGTVRLEVRTGNEVARGLYRQFGFERAGEVAEYYPDGEDAVVMILEM